MAHNQFVQSFALASAVAAAGTVVVGYPTYIGQLGANLGLSQGNFLFSDGAHKLKVGNNIYSAPKDFTLTFGNNATGITITNKTAAAWPAGSVCALGIDTNGALRTTTIPVASTRVVPVREIFIDLGSPNTASATAICTAQAIGSATNAVLNGAIVSGGVAYMDVPRGIQCVSANAGDTTQVLTITGTDEYGAAVVEQVTLNGTTVVSGKKAFAKISRIAVSAATAGNLTVGTSTVLGLPIAIKKVTQVLKEALDGAVATAGTFAYALQNTASTATTADVRGTYIPNSAPDGSRGYVITVSVPDPSDIGVAQYSV